MDKEIINGIRQYADAYRQFQQLQDQYQEYLPFGDQKTGVIGEFYAMLYARWAYPNCSIVFAPPTQSWDIDISGDSDIKIQVKTVSEYSRTRIISPIFPGWDHLYLFSLDRLFVPTGFWIVATSDIFSGRDSLRNQKMRDPIEPSSGSPRIPFGDNHLEKILPLITL